MSTATAASAVVRELAAIVGEAHCLAIEAGPLRVAPATAEEVAAVLRLCNERRLAVSPAGAGLHIGPSASRADVLLSTARLISVEHYDPGDLTVGIGAGMTLAQIDGLAAPHSQFLPIASMPSQSRSSHATIGGALAAAAQDPLKHGYGGVRDFCIGIRFVTGDGVVAKGGGRVVKNVAGYDLMKLLIGSHGTLGVITSASFKLFPRPRHTLTFVCEFPDAASAIAFRDRVTRSPLTPVCLEVVSPGAINAIARWSVLVRAAGSDAVVARYARELGSDVARTLTGGDEDALWVAVADFALQAKTTDSLLVNVSTPPSDVARAIQFSTSAATTNGFELACVGRCAVASMGFAFTPQQGSASPEQYRWVLAQLRSALSRDSLAVVVRCPEAARTAVDVWGSSPTDRDCMRAVKQAMDPARVLNPGVMGI